MSDPELSDTPSTIVEPPEIAMMIESILMVATSPAKAADIATAIGIDTETVELTIRSLQQAYEGADGGHPRHGFMLKEVAEGWRVYSRPEYSEIIAQFVVGEKTSRLTQAALETLAVVAYRQPVTRGQISAIRGVSVDGVMRTLMARGLIEEVGNTQTGAVHYGTTALFLETFGLKNLSELPKMAPNYPSAEQLPQIIEEIEDLKR